MRSASELVHQPRIHGAKRQLATPRRRPRTVNVVEEPGDLGTREVRIEQEACTLVHQGLNPAGTEGGAFGGGAAVLPNDGAMDRPARCAVPKEGGLTLVRDPNGANAGWSNAGRGEGACEGLEHARPDCFTVVFDLPRCRKVLGDGHRVTPDDVPPHLEDEHRGTRRALVDREDVRSHVRASGVFGRCDGCKVGKTSNDTSPEEGSAPPQHGRSALSAKGPGVRWNVR